MPDASQTLGVDYTATGIDTIAQSLDDLGKKTVDTGRYFDALYKKIGRTGLSGRGAAGALAPSITSNAPVRSSVSATRINIAVYVSGGGSMSPYVGTPSRVGGRYGGPRYGVDGLRQRQARLLSHLQSGTLSGNRLEDTQDAYDRVSRRLAPKSPQSRLITALRSTRFNIGETQPLIGRSLDALGVDTEAAAPGLIIAGAAVAAAKAMYDLARTSADTANAFNRISLSLGSSPATTARLSSIGAAIGLSPDRMAGIAQGIQSRITSDPMAMAAGLRLGVYNLPGQFGNQDYGQQALTVIQRLREIKNPSQRTALARAVGAEDLLPLSNVSDRQFRYAQQDAGITTSIMGGSMSQDAADFQAASSRISDAIKNLTSAAGHSEMDRLTSAFNGLASMMNTAADWANSHKGAVDMLTQFAELAIGGGASLGVLDMGRYVDSQHSKALDDNTRATEQNTAATLQPGTYGHIERQGATPYGIFNGQAYAAGRDMAAHKLSSI